MKIILLLLVVIELVCAEQRPLSLPPLGSQHQTSTGEIAYSTNQMEMYPPMSIANEQRGFKAYIKKHLMNLRRGQAGGDVFLPKNDQFDVWGGK